ncbi:hypothetical protein [Aquamicrobium sp. LC103]|uniref:hypothetical protein n=1 Tax=Aquamicrobium sp. LC103 TaxID=1120658 RepID=UPI00063E9155|nr:hypothetical protein [Aquamicrobium sp. LC103]
MEQIAALLLIIGCSEDLTQCKELPAPVPVFESSEQCDAAQTDAFRAFTRDYTQLFAKCVEVDSALEEMDAEIVWDITEAGDLVVSVEPVGDSRIVVASEKATAETTGSRGGGDLIHEP